MEKREFKVGDKVKIPKTKSVDLNTPLHKSSAILYAKEINQDFLYVVENTHPAYVLGVCLHSRNSTFHFQDLEHYEEFPEKWAIKLYPEVKKWIEEEHKTHYYSKDSENHIFHFPNWVNNNGFLLGNHTNSEVRKEYTLITLEQFEKYVLKEEQMEKQIVGYKLIKPEYEGALKNIQPQWNKKIHEEKGYNVAINSGVYYDFKKAGVLDLWFEPVYEEEFKVGDWVTVTEVEGSGWLSYCSQKTFELKKSPTHYCGGIYWGVNEGGLHAKFRKATPEEIKAAQKQIIKMYSSNKGEFEIEIIEGKAYYRPDNRELPKEWVKRIINSYDDVLTSYFALYNPYEIKIASIKVGCMEGTRKEDWEKVYKLLK